MTTHNSDTTTLNTLIATLLDSVEGYTKSADDVRDPDLAQRFRSRAQERQSAVAGLQAAVTRLGGNPEDDSSTMGGIHRAFLNLKEAVTGTDDTAIINEIERGEDYLKGKFETALKADDLAPEARSAISTAWNSVKSGHDEMSNLKHQRERGDSYREGRQDAGAQQEYASESDLRRQDDTLI
ncbi:PA2169 family four-helix-bundle protein [Novosphingobium sp. Gsoil 351]|uniref:PA2169 family four-helix-bundle protein n=1 Tax=Novosphingobium sp. Gsoil 351 TaxID=2675225 RepID=UPI0012B4EA95|nr:PA2169 family four-helix-bundle protein [Novosphingobium sp. Gsoil 351]QGN55235.1 PA2169 family four-helix-bundle protein [Novosphingobium sp. Gsoil 351]